MSTFAVHVVRVVIEPHENADALEIARVGDYRSIVRKGQFHSGDLVAYIAEQSLLPEALLDELGLRGKLAGKDGNRVKAIKLRGVLSQGLVYPARPGWRVGQDVAAELGVHKWEPPAPPAHMNGVVYAAGLDRCMRYDIENFKAYPEVLVPGEAVVFTEKIHGTWCQIGYLPPSMIDDQGHLVVSSKGLASKGLAFRPDAPENADNLYLRVARGLQVDRKISEVFVAELAADQPVFVLGEVRNPRRALASILLLNAGLLGLAVPEVGVEDLFGEGERLAHGLAGCGNTGGEAAVHRFDHVEVEDLAHGGANSRHEGKDPPFSPGPPIAERHSVRSTKAAPCGAAFVGCGAALRAVRWRRPGSASVRVRIVATPAPAALLLRAAAGGGASAAARAGDVGDGARADARLAAGLDAGDVVLGAVLDAALVPLGHGGSLSLCFGWFTLRWVRWQAAQPA